MWIRRDVAMGRNEGYIVGGSHHGMMWTFGEITSTYKKPEAMPQEWVDLMTEEYVGHSKNPHGARSGSYG